MTSEERDQKVEELLGLVEDWDTNILVRWVQASMAQSYNNLSDSEIDAEWQFYLEDINDYKEVIH
jgi:hypothetical protein